MDQLMPTPGDFEPHLGRPMRFGTVELELARVDVRTAASFSLILRGPRTAVLPEGLYDARLAEHGFGELYISPIHTPASTDQDYQVVFNG